MTEFDPRRHYWQADDGRVFSSAAMAEVSETDGTFLQWKQRGGVPTVWPNDDAGVQTTAELLRTLAVYGVGEIAPSSLPDLSPRQFAEGLWSDGIISFEEADAYVTTRAIPDALLAILQSDLFPDDNTGAPTPRKTAALLLKGATAFQFAHPLVDTIRQGQDWDVEHLRARWAVWAML